MGETVAAACLRNLIFNLASEIAVSQRERSWLQACPLAEAFNINININIKINIYHYDDGFQR